MNNYCLEILLLHIFLHDLALTDLQSRSRFHDLSVALCHVKNLDEGFFRGKKMGMMKLMQCKYADTV